MLIEYLGHAFFKFTTESGTVVTTDPYGEFYSFPKRLIKADISTISHEHHDHNGVSCLEGAPFLIRTPGKHRPADDVRITGFSCFHDEKNGTLRGPNLIFVFEIDGLRIVHCGDLGHMPDASLLKQIGKPDVLLVPIGGYYTIDSAQAVELMQLLKPTLTIPMHYRTQYNEDMPIEALDGFLSLTKTNPTPAPLLRLTKKDMTARDAVMVMDIL
jgi:L-ascorbate metabolism protein UlaG (beta-lactamase superfamily)